MAHKLLTQKPSRLTRAAVLTAVGALLLGGCATNKAPERPGIGTLSNLSVQSSDPRDFVAAASYWGGIYEQDPENAEAAAKYARSLRHLGSLQQALVVLQQAVVHHPNDAALLAEYGKALIASDKPDQAAALLAKAGALNPEDWTILSAEGVAHDEMGNHTKAKEKYEAALRLMPGHPNILTNLGLSYALSGDLTNAESMLRQAVSNPAAGAHARQNLALVLGLKGNFEEAERLAHADLPPSLVASNMSYLRSMLAQPALWQQMEALDAPIAEPATP